MSDDPNKLAIIGGSRAYALLAEDIITGERLGPRETPFGQSQPIYFVSAGRGAEFYFLSRHGEQRYSVTGPFVNYRANIYALRDLGVTRVVSWSGPGAINTDYRIGQFVIIDDLIDETRNRPTTFFEDKGVGFVRQSPTFCPDLRRHARDAIAGLADYASTGTYVCTEGPRLETAAEIRKYGICGADLVGMSLAPEVFLAKELEMCYAAICYVTNYAEGIRPGDFKPGELFEGLASAEDMKKAEAAVRMFPEIITRVAISVAGSERRCLCPRLMERYKKRGDISGDWRNWIRQ